MITVSLHFKIALVLHYVLIMVMYMIISSLQIGRHALVFFSSTLQSITITNMKQLLDSTTSAYSAVTTADLAATSTYSAAISTNATALTWQPIL
jgi:hypothetical protein